MRISDWSSDVCSSDLWVRLFMFAGLKGSDINGRWYSFMQEHLVRPVCAEFRHDLGLPTIEEMPLTQNESELVLGVNSRIFYLGVRKFIYGVDRSEEHTSELQSLMRISYAVFCLKKKKTKQNGTHTYYNKRT